MRTSNNLPIRLKGQNGFPDVVLPIGDIATVHVERQRPTIAIMWSNSLQREVRVKSINLYQRFADFEGVEEGELEEAIYDGVCTSLTGDTVEPDGWDSKGFPSKLLAAGLC